MKKFIILLANSQRYFIHALRIAIFISFVLSAGISFFSHDRDYLSYIGTALIIVFATMTLLGIWFYKIGLISGLLIFLASSVTLIVWSFKIGIGIQSTHHVVILLSGFGRLIIMMSAGLICASDCAKQIFREYVLRMGKA